MSNAPRGFAWGLIFSAGLWLVILAIVAHLAYINVLGR